MTRVRAAAVLCQICQREKKVHEVLPADMLREQMVELIRRRYPSWSPDGFICVADLNRFHLEYVEQIIEQEKGELSSLEEQVLQSIAEQNLLSENINVQFDSRRTLGDRVAEKLAGFIGSWGFLMSFGIVLALWLAINGAEVIGYRFDSFPFDVLKLSLSTLAAIQAPIILMSQNRQKSKDRLRAEQDYSVSLKAEMEIRHLNAKMDILLTRWWPRLREIERMRLSCTEGLPEESARQDGEQR